MNIKTKLIKIFSIVSAAMFIVTAMLAIICFFTCQETHYYSYYYSYGGYYYDHAEFIPYSLFVFLGSVFSAVFLFIKKKTTIFFGIAQVFMSVGAMISAFFVDDDLIPIVIFAYGSLLPVVFAYFFLPTKFNSQKIKSLFGKLFAVPMLINLFAVFFPTFFNTFDINLAINIFFALATVPCYVTILLETLPEKAPRAAVQPVYAQQYVAQPVYAQQPVAQPVYAPPVTETTAAAPVAPVEVPAATAEVQPAADIADELKRYKELLDSELITQEDFDAKKKQLLGL